MTQSHVLLRDDALDYKVVRNCSGTVGEKLLDLLGHKGEPYLSHLRDFITRSSNGVIAGLEWRFYIACDGDLPVANVCTWENCGVGILGHVYTLPEYRKRGIARRLMDLVNDDFKMRGGRALYLNTEAGSYQEAFYKSLGYRSLPNAPGSMVQVFQNKQLQGSGSLTPETFSWGDWPHLNVLLLSKVGATVRWNAIGLDALGSVESLVLQLFFQHDVLKLEGVPEIIVLRNNKGLLSGFFSFVKRCNDTHTQFDFYYLPDDAIEARQIASKSLEEKKVDLCWTIATEDIDLLKPQELGFYPASSSGSSPSTDPKIALYRLGLA